jgi:tRNA threonylcarbamoyladenosine biosynthesis protein TsaE
MEIITNTANETENIGREMGHSLIGGEIIFLKGELGAGKTTFVQGLSQGLGIEASITSPTFILMRSYQLPEKTDRLAKTLYHVDLYRLEQNVDEEARNLGIFDLWGKQDTIFVIEWADKLKTIPGNVQEIFLETITNDSRRVVSKKLQI